MQRNCRAAPRELEHLLAYCAATDNSARLMSGLRALAVAALLFNALAVGVSSGGRFRQLQAAGAAPLVGHGHDLPGWPCLRSAGPAATAWRWPCCGTPALWLLALAAGMTNVGFNWAVTRGRRGARGAAVLSDAGLGGPAGLASAGRAAHAGMPVAAGCWRWVAWCVVLKTPGLRLALAGEPGRTGWR